MVKINWDSFGQKFYNAGVDHGMLSVDGVVVPWHGLISVEQKSVGGESDPVYLDGHVVNHTTHPSQFEATITAFYSPKEFDACDGSIETYRAGLSAKNQPRKTFDFCYRSGVFNDVDDKKPKYLIHLIYNAIAEPNSVSNTTLDNNPEADSLSWDIKTATAFDVADVPSSHYILDATKIQDFVLEALEEFLYGTDDRDPAIPRDKDFQDIYVNYWYLSVVPEGDGVYSISGTDHSVINQGGGKYQITAYSVESVSNGTYEISSSTGVKQ